MDGFYLVVGFSFSSTAIVIGDTPVEFVFFAVFQPCGGNGEGVSFAVDADADRYGGRRTPAFHLRTACGGHLLPAVTVYGYTGGSCGRTGGTGVEQGGRHTHAVVIKGRVAEAAHGAPKVRLSRLHRQSGYFIRCAVVFMRNVIQRA